MKKQLLPLVMMLLPMVASSHDIEVQNGDGVTIYYNYTNDGTELAVTYRGDKYDSHSYTGNVVIPEDVTYMNRTRKVTSIGSQAFYGCSGLSSITIPNSVMSIGSQAFKNCSMLTSVTIPGNVTNIDYRTFDSCYSLSSITIPNSVTSIDSYAFYLCTGLTSITIPNSVTRIGDYAFYGCHSVTSITIPNNVTKIGDYTFQQCTSLITVTIPNSVTSIGSRAFSGCTGLTSVSIGNSVTSIGESAFIGCTGLTSIIIPNSVTSIGISAFYGCSSLTSVTIGGNRLTSIGRRAFDGVDIPTIISLLENPNTIIGKTSNDRTFTLNTFNNATLYVPKGTIDKYKATEGWKDFVFIEEGTGGEIPITQTCDIPTIVYRNGKLTFSCSTEGATFYYSITDTDIKSGSDNEVYLTVTYNISVYATKAGYENSETAKATLCWIDATPQMEGITNGVVQIPSKAVLIQSEGGILKVEGVDEGTQVSVYTLDGKQAGSSVSRNGAALVDTNIQPGNTAIVKIGNKSVKVIMK